ncbi:hypothetical protein T4A_5901 [Trichinella pseudospiralis]|uniref:Uncharacterized protein n=1 Tax=Trichinella pseudospiralis TaxID=6337 RepID=A0A0V1ASS1_TRIPS|nr:hypothetical protein T4A_5901 [Trichinella pseudospiralis]
MSSIFWSSKCAARKTPKRDNACLYCLAFISIVEREQ